MAQQSSLSVFIAELRRRRVFRVAAVYGGVAFVLFQIIDSIFEPLHIPEWIGSLIIILLLVGFPVAMTLAWIFDITPEGIVRTQGRSTGKPGTSNRALIAVTIAAVAFGIWGWMRDGGSIVGEIRSIAVLPLENLMNDPNQDYFVSGMHEALTTELSKISALRVIGRTSTMSYKANPKPISEIAAELNVDAVIEGSVLRDGDKVRITVQLVATRPERHLWTDSYDRDLRDILSLHSDVARAIAQAIKVAVTSDEETRLAESKQVSPEAYTAYLQGQQFVWKLFAPDVWRGIGQFEKAILIDSTYAEAYVGLANGYYSLAWSNQYPSALAWPKIIAAGERALELDDNLAGAHEIQAFIKEEYDWDWPGAEKEFLRTIELNPASARSHWHQAHLHLRNGRLATALEHIGQAIDLDPFFPLYYADKADLFALQGNYAEALRLYEYMLSTFPSWPYTHWLMAHLYARQGRYTDAISEVEKTMAILGDDIGDEIPFLGYLYAKLGRMEEARRQLERLDAFELAGGYASPFTRSLVHIGLGEIDSAIALIEVAMEERSMWLRGLNPSLPRSYLFSPMHNHPRFQAILQTLGFSP
ncbi:MAG: tetratricopeptide repeat protein [Candidatus Marinimicrobia bacterium]|nr:tetratricopeptide repeat protein [Candidatus Neomarinimicrobiota bacterium]